MSQDTESGLTFGTPSMMEQSIPTASVPTRVKSGRFTLLAAIFIAEAIALTVTLRTNEHAQVALARRFSISTRPASKPQPAYDRTRDPYAGDAAPEFRLLTPAGQAVSLASLRGSTAVLVFVGGCSSCSLDGVKRIAELPFKPGHHRLVLITSDGLEGAAWAEKHVGGNAEVLVDVGRTAERVYNAVWHPRAYVVSPEGRLTYCQTASEGPRETLARLRRAIGSSTHPERPTSLERKSTTAGSSAGRISF